MEKRRQSIYRITVDEHLADDLVRILVAELKKPAKSGAVFDDDLEEWAEERAVMVNPRTWKETVAVPKTVMEKHPFQNLKEGEVFLCGNVSLNRGKHRKKRFRINKTPARKLLPVTSVIKEDIKALYAGALTGGKN